MQRSRGAAKARSAGKSAGRRRESRPVPLADPISEARAAAEAAEAAARRARLAAGEAAVELEEASRPRSGIHPSKLPALRKRAEKLKLEREEADGAAEAAAGALEALLRERELQGYREVLRGLIEAAGALERAWARETDWRKSSHPGMKAADLAPVRLSMPVFTTWIRLLQRHLQDLEVQTPATTSEALD
ncbi:MAG TPA: hypothetical protein VFG76_12725, partial [Candidatus Polarisedimenticolia bacterium]|nr:hypothetical protein [Candidatus Polarisedimenticolia bacterium]